MTALQNHPYAAFLNQLVKPTRYTGAEHGAVRKDWAKVEARVCLAFPDVYDVGMSHLGYRILYSILNQDERTLAERCYAPWIDLQDKLRTLNLPLVSLESLRPLRDFDVVGFSLQFELTYTNILTMLDLGGIPLRSSARGEDDPLVVVGGPVATHMEPIAAFVDAVLIGDGEEATTEIALTWTRAKKAGVSRSDRLLQLARLPGVYVPSLYTSAIDPDTGLEVVMGPKHPDLPFPIRRRIVPDLSKFPFPDSGPVGGPEAIFDRMSIEVARGCTEGCRFCQAGMIYRPVRERDPQDIVNTVKNALKNSGQDEVSLTALSTADVSSISPLIKRLAEETAPDRVSLGVASLRAYGLADDLLDDMRKVRATGLTFAPEAGTQRMRDVINKNVTEAQLLDTAERVFARGFDKMKLYFMLGLPTEEDADVIAIMDVGRNTLNVGRRLGARATVTVSVSIHVPKPHTPFQWCAMDSLSEVRRKQGLLRDRVRGARALTLRLHAPDASVLEGVLARGDRRLSDVIERAYQRGARFDSWDDQLDLGVWWEAMEHFGIQTAPYLGTLPVTARLPWDHFHVGLEEGFLAREYRRALAGRTSPPCGKAVGQFIHHTNLADATADKRKLVCYDCGVACDLTEMKTRRLTALEEMGALTPGQRAALPVVQDPPRRPKAVRPPPEATPESEPSALEAAPDAPAAPAPDAPAAPDTAPEAAADADAAAPGPARLRRLPPEKYRPPQVGTPSRWRLKYGKTGAVALLGHLDLIRELPRVIRRAGVRTAYSQGFHPKPEMSFAPALSLGAFSVAEYVDLKLLDVPETAQELLAALNRASPPGLEFYGAAPLGPNDPGLNQVIDAADYVVVLARTVAEEWGGAAGIAARAQELLACDSRMIERDSKGIRRQFDVRPLLLELAVGEPASDAAAETAGIAGQLVTFRLRLRLSQTGGARPGEVVEALFGARVPHQLIRFELRAGLLAPLDVDAVRIYREERIREERRLAASQEDTQVRTDSELPGINLADLELVEANGEEADGSTAFEENLAEA